MDRKLREQLKEYYRAPAPAEKRDFLRKHAPQRTQTMRMLMIQARYISLPVWLLSAAVFAFAVWLTFAGVRYDIFGMVYAVIPFFSMVMLTESMKSCRYGMWELEGSALFSTRSVIMARLLILGIGNMAALAMLATLGASPLRQFLYLIVPYQLSAYAGLMLLRRYRGQEGVYLCFAASAAVAVLQEAVIYLWAQVYEARFIGLWLILAFALAVITVRESYRTVRTVVSGSS